MVDAFDDYEIEYDEIQEATEEEVKEFFQRLQEGVRLTSAEKLNAIHSNLRDFVAELTKHRFLKKVTASDKRYGHFDILAKVAAIEIDGIGVGLRYDDLNTIFVTHSKFSSGSNVAERIRSALDFIDVGFDDDSARRLANRTLVQSLLTLVCRIIEAGNARGHERRVAEFFVRFLEELNRQVELGARATEVDYVKFQSTFNANIRTGARTRQEILLRKLVAVAPALADILGPAAVIASGLQEAVRADADEIVRLIAQINDRYSAKHGEDLFKATNRTAQAHANIGRKIKDFGDYKAFVEALYHLFHESVGTRLEGRVPESFKHVPLLRAVLVHDLDHGKPQEVRAKKKKIGKVFEKYAGAPAPEGLAPERFVVVQANLLSALKKDLAQLPV